MTKTIHLVFKTHLDVGFTDYARNVIDTYFEHFIPNALKTAHVMRERGSRFIWTTGSWLIYEYLEKAPPPQRALMEAAIINGDIVWHGLPFTTHTELMNASLFRYGLSLSQKLDARFGKKTIAAKMTDVPGHTRAIVPLLHEAGIGLLHIGVNPAWKPPGVPPIFVWKDENTNTDVMVMYEEGYGGLTYVPGGEDALAFAFTEDNLGPQPPDQILEKFQQLQQTGTNVIASTMDAFAAKLRTAKPQLPVVTAEIGDTWIHGVGTDPGKVSAFRELLRLRHEWLDAGKISLDDEKITAFSNALLMIAEHTWGMDEKTHLADYTHYDMAQFQGARSLPNFRKIAASWAEQRAYLQDAMTAIHGTPIGDEAAARLAAHNTPTSTDSFVEADPVFETEHFSGRFDLEHGAITELDFDEQQWASADHPLGQFRYDLYSQADYDRFFAQIIKENDETRSWAREDMSKPGIPPTEHQYWLPGLRSVLHRQDASGQIFLLKMRVPEEPYGCPRHLWAQWTFPAGLPEIHVRLAWIDKPACRLPEALWFSFAPMAGQALKLEKLGQMISPLDVVRNGNMRLHAVENGVYYHDDTHRLQINSLDAPLVALGEPVLLNFDPQVPSLEGGIHFNLYNNLWGTNFPMWYEQNASFRFSLSFA